MTQINKPEPLNFNGLGIDPKILDIIKHFNFTIPTPIQLKSIPVVIDGKDMVGIAQTGTGKTLAFGIPILQRLYKYKGRCLILVPTRELASQVNDHLKAIAQKLNLKTVVLIGGESKYPQIKNLQRRPELIIATPGRLIDLLESKNLNLNEVKCLVLDEADLMFDMGFAPQLNKILKLAPKEKQTILFSATMPVSIMEIATKHMSLPVRIEVAPAGTPAENVIQEVIILKKEDRTVQLQKTLSEYSGSVLIFVRTKSSVKNICRNISNMNHTVSEIHSNRTLSQRTKALQGFKEGRYRILVATDIAARGIDVKGIELVLNYDLPDNIEDYIHRIGRTGRAGKMGQAISFATPSQIGAIRRIEKIIKKQIPLTKLVEINNENKKFDYDRDNRSLGFQSFRGHRKNNTRSSYKPSGYKPQDKKWDQKKSPSDGQNRYKKFDKNRADKSFGGQSRGFNRFDANKKSATAESQDKKPSDDKKTGDFNRHRSSRPFKKSGHKQFNGERKFSKKRY
ncbi:MAG: DEAD/DEAH box helicase [Candidatus Buchananbacteria bacterium]|nr:DEAD/DEAH box helicase [Candidatus Buchananbacteria bacterium]